MRGKLTFLHGKREDDSSAFDKKENGRIKILLPASICASSVEICIFISDGTTPFSIIEAKKNDVSALYDEYIAPVGHLCSDLYFFTVKVGSPFGIFYAKKEKFGKFSLSDSDKTAFQLSVSDFEYPQPPYLGGIIYHVFVDRFAKGTKAVTVKESAVYVDNWNDPIPEYPDYPGAPIKNNYFYGGTLDGITERISYIADLGVSLIYLSPIFDSPSNHKYDTSDYLKVDEMFGGDDALKRLIKAAEKYGIGIILDGVFNHTGADSRYFDIYGRYGTDGAYQNKNSVYHKWYDFKHYPDDYTCWWGIKILPRINPDIPECGDFIAGDGGVVEKYARLGIKGYRLDVVDELSDSFIQKIKERLFSVGSDKILYGEVWEDGSNKIAYGNRKKYYLGKELDGVMNYPVRSGIIEYLKYKKTDKLYYALYDVINNAPRRIRDMQMNLLGSHDTERIITTLGGACVECIEYSEMARMKLSEEEYKKGRSLLKCAYTILATLPGIPSVYYADEVGLQGYKDPFNRLPYPYGKEDLEILSYYKKIGNIRRSSEVFADGEFRIICIENELLITERFKHGRHYYTVINNSNEEIAIDLSHRAMLLISEKRVDHIVLPPMTAEVIKSNLNLDIYI